MKDFISVLYYILSFFAIIATALLVWVNWDNIVEHFDNLINPETQEEQTDDSQNDDEQALKEQGITLIELE